MLQRRVLTALFCFATVSQGACMVVPAGGPRRAAVGGPACHPSQYWDGHQCRHKGQGRGARKHDGR